MSAVSTPAVPARTRGEVLAGVLPSRSNGLRRVEVLGVKIDDLGLEDAIAAMRALARGRTCRTLFIVNAHTLNLACASPRYRAALNAADIVFNDGIGVRLGAWLRGTRLKANLNGTDLVPAFMRAADKDRLSYFLLGARPEVLARTIAVMREAYPGWTLVGHHHGYIDRATGEDVVRAVARARPHLLLVGMGNPLQETFIHENKDRLEASLCVGVGGLFSYLSGDYRRAPRWMRRIGLEWAAIIVLQRHKWRRYVVGNPVFLARLALERLKPLSGRR